MGHLRSKNGTCLSLWIHSKEFFKFCTMKWDKRYMEITLTVFLKKILIWRKWAIFGLKKVLPHNFGSTVRISLKFCTMKGTKRYMKLILRVFLKKSLFGASRPFLPENGMLS